jgi:hypothetical protein
LLYRIQLDDSVAVYRDSITEAISVWNGELGRNVFREAIAEETPQVMISWGPVSGNEVAGTQHYGGPHPVRANVIIRQGVNTHRVYLVAIHELGHVLGLQHSDSPNSVMWPKPRRALPTDGEISLLRQIYRLIPISYAGM